MKGNNRASRGACHSAVTKALKNGSLKKQPCAVCGTTDEVHAHHGDYSRPLDVVWLCPNHHAEKHPRAGNLAEKAQEAAVVKAAVRFLVSKNPEWLLPESDCLAAVSDHLGLTRSCLGTWASPKGVNWITSHGIRSICAAIEQCGEIEAASHFRRNILACSLERRADTRKDGGQ